MPKEARGKNGRLVKVLREEQKERKRSADQLEQSGEDPSDRAKLKIERLKRSERELAERSELLIKRYLLI